MINSIKLWFLGLSLIVMSVSIFEDVYRDGALSPTWSSMAMVGALIGAISLIK